MTPTAITVLAIAVVLIALGVTFAVIRLKHDLAQLTPEQRQRHDEIVAADRAIRVAQSEYDSAVRAANKTLNKAKEPAPLAVVGGAVVSETGVVVTGVTHPLVPGISAKVDETGGLQVYTTARSTSTKVVQTVHTADLRQLYLIVTAPDWQEVLQLPPDDGPRARQFAATLYSASQNAAENIARFEARLASAQASYDAAVANTAALEAAKRARTVLELDPLEELRRARRESKRQVPAPTQAEWPTTHAEP